MPVLDLPLEPLTRDAFAPFGDVIETGGAERLIINQGTTERYHDLAGIDVSADGGVPLVSIFRGQPRPRPIEIRMMERHPLGSQAFIPLRAAPWVVVVGPPGDRVAPGGLRAFRASGDQGVNYRRGTWHHPLLVLEADHRFLVIDRGGAGANCDEVDFGGIAALIAV